MLVSTIWARSWTMCYRPVCMVLLASFTKTGLLCLCVLMNQLCTHLPGWSFLGQFLWCLWLPPPHPLFRHVSIPLSVLILLFFIWMSSEAYLPHVFPAHWPHRLWTGKKTFPLLPASLVLVSEKLYFQTLSAPSLLLEMRRRWFVWAEANPRIQSWWHPALSVAAVAKLVFDLLDVWLPLSTPGTSWTTCTPLMARTSKLGGSAKVEYFVAGPHTE